MAKALWSAAEQGQEEAREDAEKSWSSRMSDHVAYALLVYTGLQIFMTVQAMKTNEGMSILPYLALVALVAAIIPACRKFEKRWQKMDAEVADESALRGTFRRDVLLLWTIAIGLPVLLTLLFKGLAAIG